MDLLGRIIGMVVLRPYVFVFFAVYLVVAVTRMGWRRTAVFSVLAMRDNVAPPTLNLDNPSVETGIDLIPHVPKKREINIALSNSFGFGGTNACLVLRRVA